MEIDLRNLTIKKAHIHLKNGDFSAVDLTKAYLQNIKERDVEIHAYLEVFKDAIEQAKKADEMIKGSQVTLMTGIPMAVKDNILIKDKISSSASKMLENHRAVYNATVIKKLKEQGAVFLGRTNMDEFAMGGSTENSAFGITKNPTDLERVPGGSSGGSAAAVAGDLALCALGTDTGGSIRQPASFCGIYGLKPTYGAVSRYGAMAMGSSLDQIGPIAKNPEDLEIIFNVIKGEDKLDSTTIPDKLRVLDTKEPKVIGVPEDFLKEGVDSDVLDNFKDSLQKMESLGLKIKTINLQNLKYALPIYYIIMPAEASTNLARYDGVRYGLHKDGESGIDDYFKSKGSGFGKEVRRRIMLGTYVLSAGYYDAYYNKATSLRKILRDDLDKVFKDVDIIATPTSPTPAFKIGEKLTDPISMYLADIFTITANLTGNPSASIPDGFVQRGDKNLPTGLLLTAPHLREDFLFKVGKDFLGD